MEIVKRIFPFLTWFDDYDRSALRADFVSGLTVALVLVPQSMAYAQLAGLPAYYGLYAAFLPPMVASLFGSSRQLATGPVAVVSLMTAAALEPLATAGSEPFIAYAVLLALMVGVVQLVLGVLRLGLVVNFLSHPVVNGFTNAAAIIIATSQLSKIFGVTVDKAPHHYETVYRVIEAALGYTHWPTLGMAVLAFAVMIGLRRLNPRLPAVLAAVVITTALSWLTGFQQDRTVALARIDVPELAPLVAELNETLETRELLERHRAEGQRGWAELARREKALCLRCHEQRDVSLFARGEERPQRRRRVSGEALIVHQRSGLIDAQIADLKRSAAELRAELRELLLVSRDGPEGEPRFALRDSSAPDAAPGSAGPTWRIKVGNTPLLPDALPLTGGGAVVATIPRGIPALSWPEIDFGVLSHLVGAALIISLLGFMEAISIAKAMAARTRQKLDANQELIGQGLANIVGCMGQSYAVSGSFSRSAVNLQAGARTGLSNVFSSAVVLVVLLFLAPGLYHLPQAVLASIIMMAVLGLLNVRGFVHAWRTNHLDGVVSVLTFGGTLAFAPHLEQGILIGVSLSLVAYLYRSMRPQVVELAPHADGAMRDAKRHGLRCCDHIAVVRFEGALYFASASYRETEILDRVAELPELRQVLIASNGISEIDASGEEMLRHVVDNLREAGFEVSFSGMPEGIVDVLKRSRLFQRIGAERFFDTRAEAIAALYADAHAGSTEERCPYLQLMPPIEELSLHSDGSLRSARRHHLPVCRHIAAFRFDAPLTFANTAYLEKEVLTLLGDRPALRHVVFVAHGVPEIDAAGAEELGALVERLRKDGLAVSFSGIKEPVREGLEQAGVDQIIGPESIYPTQIMAIAGIYARAHTGSSEQRCPLHKLAPHLTELSVHHTGTLREARQHHLKLCQHTAVLRFDGPLVLHSGAAIQSEFIRWAKTRPSVLNVVFLAQTLPELGETESSHLLSLVEAVREAGYRVVLANFSDQVFEDLGRRGVADAIGPDDIYPLDVLAIAAIHTEAHQRDPEGECPFELILPRLTQLSMHSDGSLRDASRHGLALCRRIVAVRMEGPLNFATIGIFEEKLKAALEGRPEARHVLLAGHTLQGLDPIAAEETPRLFARLIRAGCSVSVSGLHDKVVDMLKIIGRPEDYQGVDTYPTQAAALEAIGPAAHQGSDERVCPLTAAVRIDSG